MAGASDGARVRAGCLAFVAPCGAANPPHRTCCVIVRPAQRASKRRCSRTWRRRRQSVSVCSVPWVRASAARSTHAAPLRWTSGSRRARAAPQRSTWVCRRSTSTRSSRQTLLCCSVYLDVRCTARRRGSSFALRGALRCSRARAADPADPRAAEEDRWGVGEHTDYGVITLLKQARGRPGSAAASWCARLWCARAPHRRGASASDVYAQDDCGGLEVRVRRQQLHARVRTLRRGLGRLGGRRCGGEGPSLNPPSIPCSRDSRHPWLCHRAGEVHARRVDRGAARGGQPRD